MTVEIILRSFSSLPLLEKKLLPSADFFKKGKGGEWPEDYFYGHSPPFPFLKKSAEGRRMTVEIISTVILLPSADSFKKGFCQLQA